MSANFADEVLRARARLQAMGNKTAAGPDASTDKEVLLAELTAAVEELEVAHEELEVQTQELESARELLDAERTRYHDLFTYAPDAYLVTDRLAVVQEANLRAGELLGRTPDQLVGKPLAMFVDGTVRRDFRNELALLRPGTVREWETRFAPLTAPSFVAVVRASATGGPRGRTTLRWLLRDTSERLRTEEALRNLEAGEREREAHEPVIALPAPQATTQLEVVPIDQGVRIVGEADLATADVLRAGLEGLRTAGGSSPTLDLRDLAFLDARCASMLLAVAHDLPPEGRLVLLGARPIVARILRLLGADRHPRISLRTETA